MPQSIRRPEEILAFRSLEQILQTRPRTLWSVGPADSVSKAVQIMADHNIGCVVVLDGGRLAGILSERDCARQVLLAKKSPDATTVADVMTRNVVSATSSHTFADCLRLMHQHSVRHLPVVDGGKVVTVVSIRDLLSEAVAHHARIILELERERLEIFTPTT